MKFIDFYNKTVLTLNEDIAKQISPETAALNTSAAIQKSDIAKDPNNAQKINKLKQDQSKVMDTTSTLIATMNTHLQSILNTFPK